MSIRRLFFDIEVSFNVGAFWRTGMQYVGYEAILKEAAIICICYKFEGHGKVHSLQWDKDQGEKAMLQKFLAVAIQADELVAHNGDKFDLPWIRTRCLLNNVPMMPTYTTIDTLKSARSGFRFNSNRLDYLSKIMGGKGKEKTAFDLWIRVAWLNCRRSLKEMVNYCKKDVLILESVFTRMNPYLKHKTSQATYKDQCPQCNSENTHISLRRTSAAGVKSIQFKCRDCGKYHTVTAGNYYKAKAQKKKEHEKAFLLALKLSK